MALRLSTDEARAFLAHGTRTGKLAVVRSDGAPLVVPIWFVADDDGSLVFNTGADTTKGRALRRDPRVCICVDEQSPPVAYVRVDGIAEISDDVEAILPWATAIARATWGTTWPRRTAGGTRCPASCSSASVPRGSSRWAASPTRETAGRPLEISVGCR
jgi:PPOX class probable F420-dependent enzyme